VLGRPPVKMITQRTTGKLFPSQLAFGWWTIGERLTRLVAVRLGRRATLCTQPCHPKELP
jgi:hypothetical protein